MIFNQDILSRTQNINLPEPQEIGLSDDPKGSLFSDVVNMRRVEDGYMTVMKMRGGTSSTGTNLPSPAVRSYPFTTRINSGVKQLIAYQRSNGLSIYNVSDGYLVTVSLPFTVGSTPVEFTALGQFLYVFSSAGPLYINLSTLTQGGSLAARKWLATSAPKIGVTVTPAKKVNGEGEVGPLGFEIGARVIAFPHFDKGENIFGADLERITLQIAQYFNNGGGQQAGGQVQRVYAPGYVLEAGNTYVYRYLGGEYLTVNGVDYKDLNRRVRFTPDNDTNAIVRNEGGTALSILKTSGLRTRFNEGLKPFEASITRIQNYNTSSYTLLVEDENGKEHQVNSDESHYKVIPYNADLDSLLDYGARFFKNAIGEVEEDPDYTDPAIHRGYCLVEVLDDGSVTAPGFVGAASVSMGDMQDNTGQLKSVDLNIPAPAPNVVSRYLFSTRWQSTLENVYKASTERHPNGPFYFHSEIEAKAYSQFEDSKSDKSLLVPMSSDVDLIGGVTTNLIPSGQDSGVVPRTGTSFKNSLLVGGYTINRPQPVENQNVFISVSGSGSATPEVKLKIYFKYSDGTYGQPLIKNLIPGLDYSVRVGALNVLVSSVEVIAEVSGQDKFVKTFGQQDPEFNGLPVEFRTLSADLNALPSRGAVNVVIQPALDLNNFIAVAENGQVLAANRQYKIFDSSTIKRFYVTGIDARDNVIRFRVVALTDENVQSGVLIETGNAFFAEFQITSQSDNFTNIHAAIRVGSNIVCVTNRGLVLASDSSTSLLLDRKELRAPNGELFFADGVTGIAYNSSYSELMIFTTYDYVCVYNFDTGVKWFRYSTGFQTGCSVGGDVFAVQAGGANRTITRLEVEGTSQVIEAELITRPIGVQTVYTRINSVALFGNGLSISVQVDNHAALRMSNPPESWEQRFEASVTTSQAALSMNGVYYDIKSQGIMPRLRFRFSGTTGFLSNIIIKSQTLPKRGRRV